MKEKGSESGLWESTGRVKIAKSYQKPRIKLTLRVRSWLRMNAGGVLNTCKSNEALV